MVSFAFLLCSTLLLSGAFAAPYPNATEDIITFANNNYDLPETINTDISAEYVNYDKMPKKGKKCVAEFPKFSFFIQFYRLQRSLGQEAAQAGVKVLIDVLDGKDVKTSVLDR